MINSTLLSLRLNGTSRDDMVLFLEVVIRLLGTTSSNMTKGFTAIALDNTRLNLYSYLVMHKPQ